MQKKNHQPQPLRPAAKAGRRSVSNLTHQTSCVRSQACRTASPVIARWPRARSRFVHAAADSTPAHCAQTAGSATDETLPTRFPSKRTQPHPPLCSRRIIPEMLRNEATNAYSWSAPHANRQPGFRRPTVSRGNRQMPVRGPAGSPQNQTAHCSVVLSTRFAPGREKPPASTRHRYKSVVPPQSSSHNVRTKYRSPLPTTRQ